MMLKIEIPDEFKQLCETCFKKWGPLSQLLMLTEETGEAFKALWGIERGKPVTPEEVAEELADAFIMLAEFIGYYDLTGMVNTMIPKKLDRLQARLKNVGPA